MTEVIRKVEPADFASILEMIHEFETESFAEYGFKCDDAITLSIMPSFVKSSLIMAVEGKIVGVIGGIVNRCPTDGTLMFQEALWFVKKEYRSRSERLLEAMESYAKNVLHVSKLVMCSFGGDRRDTKDRFWRKRGYVPFEVHYLKNLKTEEV